MHGTHEVAVNLIDMLLRRGYWRRCRHRGHWTHRRSCLRGMAYDGYCQKHNRMCWGYCGLERR